MVQQVLGRVNPNAIMLAFEDGEHAEIQLLRVAKDYVLKLSIASGQPICDECEEELWNAGIRVFGPLNKNYYPPVR